MLKTKEAPVRWCISNMFPDKSDKEISELVAAFFNAISNEYNPIPNPRKNEVTHPVEFIAMHEIASRLKSFKKPKTQVFGDLNPALVNKFYDFLAIPLHYLFNKILNTLEWPDLWKMETVYVIPKNSAPASLGELRNLSCTPLVSKVLESFVLSRLQSEIKLSSKQYGGIKNCSTDHFLVDTWDRIITILENNNAAANLVSIDFEKAFNRMDHEECLKALCTMGATMTSVDWVAAFLHGRMMRSK